MARDAGFDVWEQKLPLPFDLPNDRFDGIFANASLFHVPSQELPRILSELRATLKPDGVLFSSNLRECAANNEACWNNGRYGAYHDLDAWRSEAMKVGFIEPTAWLPPARPAV